MTNYAEASGKRFEKGDLLFKKDRYYLVRNIVDDKNSSRHALHRTYPNKVCRIKLQVYRIDPAGLPTGIDFKKAALPGGIVVKLNFDELAHNQTFPIETLQAIAVKREEILNGP